MEVFETASVRAAPATKTSDNLPLEITEAVELAETGRLYREMLVVPSTDLAHFRIRVRLFVWRVMGSHAFLRFVF